MKISKGESKVLDYFRRNVDSERKVQDSMEKVAQAIGVSRATVYRALKKLEKNDILEIVKTDANKEANIVILNEDIDIKLSEIDETISNMETHIQKEYKLLNEIKERRKEIEELSEELEGYHKNEQRIIKTIDFNNYEILVKRKESAEVDENIEKIIEEALNQKMIDFL